MRNPLPPKIVVKRERASPELPSGRHRPRRLDLSTSAPTGTANRPSGSLTAKDNASIQDVGLACLSPGLHTLDPTMREQLQRSINVRDRQRQIIEARQKGSKGDIGEDGSSVAVGAATTAATPSNISRSVDCNAGISGLQVPQTGIRRRGPPPGLTIAPPSHQQFANERVIQSAPLNQSFTGLRQHSYHSHMPPLSRQVAHQSSGLSHASHVQHLPATQTKNRLPPLSDVFPGESLAAHSSSTSSNPNQHAPLPSPGVLASRSQQNSQPQPQQLQRDDFHSRQHSFRMQAPHTSVPREYRTAEEAVQSLTGGREDLLPRLVHYGGHQPPTPPSPLPSKTESGHGPLPTSDSHRSIVSGRRRGRDEYEREMGTPPLGTGRSERRRGGPLGQERDTPDTNKSKKEEFIALCEQAWDLFHS